MADFAFYAPLKSPDHSVPSGDRAMARALMLALKSAGNNVDLVSEFRSLDPVGDASKQRGLISQADLEVQRLLKTAQQKKWRVWVTYHNYYKAPDLIGPAVSAALNIPYVQVESTRAHKRLNGPWAAFARASEAACDHANVIFHLTANDRITLIEHQISSQKIVHLAPFLAQDALPELSNEPQDISGLLCVGMMRAGDKLASYRIIADALPQLKSKDWTLKIAGDGPARGEINALFHRFTDRISYLGELDENGMNDAYATATLLIWPGVNEAFGMIYLEAQANGLAVVAQDRPGVRDVVHGGILAQPDSPTAFANAIDDLLSQPAKHTQLGRLGREIVKRSHLIPAAKKTLMSHIQPLIGEPA